MDTLSLLIRYAGLLDLTYPITSLFTGGYFNWTLTETFPPELDIEDLWIPYYCVSTDVTVSRERIHTSGTYCMSKKSCPYSYSKYTLKI